MSRCLRLPRLPADGQAAGPAAGGPRLRASAPWQPPMVGGTPASGKSVAARGPRGPAG
jgi:hypothetical protein